MLCHLAERLTLFSLVFVWGGGRKTNLTNGALTLAELSVEVGFTFTQVLLQRVDEALLVLHLGLKLSLLLPQLLLQVLHHLLLLSLLLLAVLLVLEQLVKLLLQLLLVGLGLGKLLLDSLRLFLLRLPLCCKPGLQRLLLLRSLCAPALLLLQRPVCRAGRESEC